MAQTGRKPKPTALHDAHGTGNTTRLKQRKNEPIADGDLKNPPEHLTADQKADWVYAVAHAPAGVLGACDQGAMEVYIVARDHHRKANIAQQALDLDNALPLLMKTAEVLDRHGKVIGGGNIIQSPYLGIMSTAGARMLRAAAELGFTPATVRV
jgi:phage terminase small subunit